MEAVAKLVNDASSPELSIAKAKLAGMEFTPGDTKAWDTHVKGLESTNSYIDLGEYSVRANSTLGQAEILKGELVMKWGYTPDHASKLVGQKPEVMEAKAKLAERAVYTSKIPDLQKTNEYKSREFVGKADTKKPFKKKFYG